MHMFVYVQVKLTWSSVTKARGLVMVIVTVGTVYHGENIRLDDNQCPITIY